MGLKNFFSGQRTDEGFKPSTLYNWLWPEVSGNDINGLGSSETTRPIPLMWHNLPRITHKWIQLLFKFKFRPRIIVQHTPMSFRFAKLKIQKRLLRKQVPSEKQIPYGVLEATQLVIDKTLEFGGEDVGITKLKEEWMFQGYELPDWADKALKEDKLFVVLFLVQHDPACFNQAPGWAFSKEIAHKYNDGSDIAVKLSKWILGEGYNAYGHGGPEAGEFVLTPVAISAGLGELGKHGSLINKKLGPNFRIGCVYTTLPLQTNQEEVFGVDDFCSKCQICLKECPPNAISNEKKMVRGVEKFYVDFDKCMPFMTDNYGCGICLKVCPWSNDKTASTLIDKYIKRKAKTVSSEA